MEKLNQSIDWKRINSILLSHYTVGTSSEGADAYPPLLLYKCLLLQKWFHPRGIGSAFHRAGINSNPELENQINDRLSFKKFLALSFSKPSPDHSTFSRFRARVSKKAMDQINSEILRQFEAQGLTINEGIAVDARLVKSTSRRSEMRKSKKPEISIIRLKANLTKTESRLNSTAIWTLTGLFKKIYLTMGSKNIPALIPITALCWQQP